VTAARGWDVVDGDVEIRRVQPYQAVKTYRCPGCNGDIVAGQGHYVVVPVADQGSRRHWHHACWEFRDRRR
jgi:hypothetical protein